jgi:hypothetical protein
VVSYRQPLLTGSNRYILHFVSVPGIGVVLHLPGPSLTMAAVERINLIRCDTQAGMPGQSALGDLGSRRMDYELDHGGREGILILSILDFQF